MGYIYCFVFPNGKRYVGQTIRKPKYRWNNGKGYTVGTPVKAAIDEFGWQNVNKLCYEVPDSELDEQERYWIEKYKTTDPEYGYNIQSGGKNGFAFPHSEEHCRKISESQIGRVVTEKTRERISEAKRGSHLPKKSEITRRRMSESQRLRRQKEKGLA